MLILAGDSYERVGVSDGNPDILVTETQFAAALAEASSMDEESLKAESGSGQARSYFVRHGGRLLPLKAVLRLAYQRAGVPWNGVQSELAARRLRNRFEVLHLLDAADEPNTPPQPDFGRDPESTRVYIANFGEGNALWPIAKANQTIITIDNVAVHSFWQAGDRGYADYARALVNSEALDPWHETPLFKEKAAASRKQGVRIFSPKERAAARMFRTMLDTVAQANGQTVERQVKEKTTSLNQQEWEELLRVKLGEQEDLCALTGLPLGYDGECEDKELLASLDRIDSNGHYTADNVQIVCRFMNRWKGADEDGLVRRLLEVLQGR
jgi:hypothetical protein